MESIEKLQPNKKPLMVLGTSSGAGKSITVTAICRILKKLEEEPIPFKGQNMSNNAWVDWEGGERHIHKHYKLLPLALILLLR